MCQPGAHQHSDTAQRHPKRNKQFVTVFQFARVVELGQRTSVYGVTIARLSV